MAIKIIGNSGCEIEIKNEVLYKTSRDISYIPRLKKQAIKQKRFLKSNKLPFIIVPKIITEIEGEDFYSVCMKYFNAQDYIQYLDYSNKNLIDNLINNFISIIEQYDKNSKMEKIPFSRILKKLYETIDKTRELKLDKVVNYFENYEEKEIVIPIGFCHGDLTLSNILFLNDNLILIDFLDNFIETPLQDMVKIRQDTFFKWSYNLYLKDFDKNKIDIIMDYMDDKIHKILAQKYEYYNKYYKPFQILNLTRILPYTKNELLKESLIKNINDLVDNT